MKPYKKIYCDAFGYDYDDKTSYIPSEISSEPSVDIHHIVTREDRIENLMAVTRDEHNDYGDKKVYMPYLLKIHMRHLQLNNIEFDMKWFEFYIKKYEGLNG